MPTADVQRIGEIVQAIKQNVTKVNGDCDNIEQYFNDVNKLIDPNRSGAADVRPLVDELQNKLETVGSFEFDAGYCIERLFKLLQLDEAQGLGLTRSEFHEVGTALMNIGGACGSDSKATSEALLAIEKLSDEFPDGSSDVRKQLEALREAIDDRRANVRDISSKAEEAFNMTSNISMSRAM